MSEVLEEVSAEKPVKEKKVPLEKRFNEFQEQTTGALASILELLQQKQATPATIESQKKAEEGKSDDVAPIPPGWIKAVHEILGEDFNCSLTQPDGGGTIFKIIVPWGQSNCTPMEKAMKPMGDVRSREIGNTGLAGVKEWALKVRANLLKSGKKLVQYP